MSPGTVFGVFWAVTVGAMGVGWALPQVGVIVTAKLAAGEIFSIIDRARFLNATPHFSVLYALETKAK